PPLGWEKGGGRMRSLLIGLAGFLLGLGCWSTVGPVTGQPRSLPRIPFTSDTIAQIAQKAIPAVVNIDTVMREVNPFQDLFATPYFTEKGVGSGFLIDASGLIVTNDHVVADTQSLTVTLTNGQRFTGRKVGHDPLSDVALIRIKGVNLPTLRLGDSESLRVGDWAIAIGSPLGLQKSVTAGIVSALNREIAINERVNFIQTDAAINPGNSGGPLLNIAGEVIGVNNLIATRAQGIGFAIPSNLVRSIVDQLVSKGKIERPWMGIALTSLPSNKGVLVAGVSNGSPAAQAGLRPGDVITHLDGRSVQTPGQIVQYINGKSIGDRLEVRFLRNEKEKRISLVLREMPVS
ncbi:MAG TPA: trypsin-like peptidase domain-containing protein, partial [Chroococcales cyanobacterium]